MKQLYLTKNSKSKFQYLNNLIKEYDTATYFCPKKYLEQVKDNICNSHIFCYEDIQKTNRFYDVTNKDTLLILDGSVRYKSISSYIFKRLSKLCLTTDNVIVVDTVPFISDIKYLYVPISRLGREILGFQHWYAFRENNAEKDEYGNIVNSHDFTLNAKKLAPFTKIDYNNFLENKFTTVYTKITDEEKSQYKLYRDKLFAERDTPQPIITRLADFANTQESHYECLTKTVEEMSGKIFVYTNIKSHNKKIKSIFKNNKNVEIKTFYDVNENEESADHIILSEVPIVKSYLFLDILSNIRKDCDVTVITGHTTIDKLLYKHMYEEFTAIDEFTKILNMEVKKCH